MNTPFKKILPLLFHPAVLAIPVSILVLLFAGIDVDPYRLSLLDIDPANGPDEKVWYEDIDSDGERELLRAYQMGPAATLLVYTNGGEIYETWNFPGSWVYEPDIMLFDSDGNGISEAYALTATTSDTLLVSRQELGKSPSPMVSRKVCELGRYNGSYDHRLYMMGHKDLDGDGHHEIIFTVNAGFTYQPRAIYTWDQERDIIRRSPEAGINYKISRELITSAGSPDEGTPGEGTLIYTGTGATDNFRTPAPYPDTGSYAVVLDENLDYLFDPVCLGGPQSFTLTYPYTHMEE